MPQDTKLTVRSKGLPAWDSLNADQKRLYARMMEVFAGYAAHCDHELGRVVEACKQRGIGLCLWSGPEHVQHVFEVTGLYDLLPFTDRFPEEAP